tara:strand:+ start:1271 stop:1528 length:258 start_codon:yes stop_codon:yes gene_type:complete
MERENLINNGWKPRVINGVRVLELRVEDKEMYDNSSDGYTMYSLDEIGAFWSDDQLSDVTSKLGEPDKYHTHPDLGVMTIEYSTY